MCTQQLLRCAYSYVHATLSTQQLLRCASSYVHAARSSCYAVYGWTLLLHNCRQICRIHLSYHGFFQFASWCVKVTMQADKNARSFVRMTAVLFNISAQNCFVYIKAFLYWRPRDVSAKWCWCILWLTPLPYAVWTSVSVDVPPFIVASFLGAFSKLRKATLKFVMSVRLSA
jgi:hypothetical protein